MPLRRFTISAWGEAMGGAWRAGPPEWHLGPGWAHGPLGLQPGGKDCDIVIDEQTHIWPLCPELLKPLGRLSDGVMGASSVTVSPSQSCLSL